jgi:hypothetical protein
MIGRLANIAFAIGLLTIGALSQGTGPGMPHLPSSILKASRPPRPKVCRWPDASWSCTLARFSMAFTHRQPTTQWPFRQSSVSHIR